MGIVSELLRSALAFTLIYSFTSVCSYFPAYPVSILIRCLQNYKLFGKWSFVSSITLFRKFFANTYQSVQLWAESDHVQMPGAALAGGLPAGDPPPGLPHCHLLLSPGHLPLGPGKNHCTIKGRCLVLPWLVVSVLEILLLGCPTVIFFSLLGTYLLVQVRITAP